MSCMSSSETEGAENTDDELSSTDLDSYNDNIEEEFPLQQDIHQKNLIAIHITEKRKKGEGELNGLRYMIVDENDENDEYDEDDIHHKPHKNSDKNTTYVLNKRHQMVMFPLPTYSVSDTLMIISYLTSAMFIFTLIVIIPILNKIITPLNALLITLAIIFGAIGIFCDGKFYLNFNLDTKQIFIQQKMCVGNCICGNKGVQGKLLGNFETFVNVSKVKINDVIGENTYERWQFILTFNDHENGEECNMLFITTNEEMIDNLERNVNEWWKQYTVDYDANVKDDYH